jgi:alpha-L-fucosidase
VTERDSAARPRARPLPGWYDDAKLGIFVHWGLYSVPAWAPLSGRLGEIEDHFKNNPYAEWYRNTLAIEESPTRAHHARVWGEDFPYEAFAPRFDAAARDWEPEAWAELFARTHARYVVLTTKHHDGFLLWPSAHRNPKAPDFVAERDLVGEFTAAVRARGLRMGLYYSGGIDWLWHDVTIRTGPDLVKAIPRDPAYLAYATAHWRELFERYTPALMWNDIAFPGPMDHLDALFDAYYAQVPEGVINDRFKHERGPDGLRARAHHDFTTPEYRVLADIQAKKWEACRGVGHSFGFNRDEGPEQYLSGEALIRLFVDIVSKNGNLLLNVGPRADGSIPDFQRAPLEALGAWLDVNGEAIFATRPWVRAADTSPEGIALRYTRRGDDLYVTLLASPLRGEVTLPVLPPAPSSRIVLLGAGGDLAWKRSGPDVRVSLPRGLAPAPAHVLRITPAPSV